MKTLVIHPKDVTTNFLCDIYSDKDWTIINSNVVSHSHLKKLIKSHDRIIMLGHGDDWGLYANGRYIIDSSLVYLLRDKFCICIWCNANVFVEKHDLNGFYSGMIISEYEEALMYNIPTNLYFLSESNKDFATAIKLSIDKEDILQSVKKLYEGNSAVVGFNRESLFYKNSKPLV